MKGAIKLGRVSGIKIEVHWTFTLLLLWVAFTGFRQGADVSRVLLNELLIVVLFVCVVLHELGHALTARRFNIKTQKIMLLPIGGVATLERMPKKPSQELLVALAGPSVNVVIAVVLSMIIPIDMYLDLDAVVLEEILSELTVQNFLLYLLIANIMLVLFNLIPAFPMDGGRALRALLSFRLGRVAATKIAAIIGQVLAILLFVLGVLSNPFLVFIALFIFFGAYAENQMVKQTSLLKGHRVKDAMLKYITRLHPEDTVQKAIDTLLAGSEKDFVVADGDTIVGILTKKAIIKNAINSSLLVKDIMKDTFTSVDLEMEIIQVLELFGTQKVGFFPVTEDERLVGAIDKGNISEFVLIKNVHDKKSDG